MVRLFFLLAFSFFHLCLAAQAVEELELKLEPFISGFVAPVDIASAGDDRLFVVEKRGRIHVLDDAGQRLPEPFLNIQDRVRSSGNEQGLLGLAFHPDYAANGYFYLHYTRSDGDSRIARFRRDPENADRASADSEMILLEVNQPFSNHNGGDLAFGPDGYLYIGLGDGGSAGDPEENGQDRLSLLGKMLRIDVDSGDPYAIPEDNPFAVTDFALDEIWALGLRNPWRFSFDRGTGDLWIADVGQNRYEEVNVQPAGSVGGENYGWDCYEGFSPFEGAGCPAADQLTVPVYAYSHSDGGCSVTGGRVYRGTSIPALQGVYVFTDYCDGLLRGLVPGGEGAFTPVDFVDGPDFDLVAFGEDAAGELFVAGLGSGTIYRIVSENPVSALSLEDMGIASLSLQPNPSTDWLSLKLEWDSPRPVRIQLLDVQGRLVRERFFSARQHIVHRFDLPDLPAGIYLVRLVSQGRQITRKIVRN